MEIKATTTIIIADFKGFMKDFSFNNSTKNIAKAYSRKNGFTIVVAPTNTPKMIYLYFISLKYKYVNNKSNVVNNISVPTTLLKNILFGNKANRVNTIFLFLSVISVFLKIPKNNTCPKKS